MAYSNLVCIPLARELNNVQAADTVLLTWTVPSNLAFTLERVITRVSTAAGASTSGAIKVGKGTSTSWVLLKSCTGVGISAGIGVTKCDKVASVTGATNHFVAGDVLEIRVATTCTSTGKVDVDIIVGLDN